MLHGGRVWEAARELGVDPRRILDFSANLNPWGPPPRVMAVLRRHLADIARYPEPRGGELRGELAAHLGVPPANLVVGNGAAELIYLFCRAVAPCRALVPAPTFGEYARAVRSCGGEVDFLPLDPPDFRLAVDRVAAALRRGRYDLLVLCNPNNPTGTLTPGDRMAAILKEADRAGTWVLVDECFLGFLPRPEEHSLRRLAACHGTAPGPVVLDSFTKLYCLPGLRLGYLVGPSGLIERMEENRDPWSVNLLAQGAGRACLRETGYLERTRRSLPGFREGLARALSALPGLTVFPSDACFLLLRASGGHCGPPGAAARSLAARLARRLILVRDCSDFPGLEPGGYLRVAVRLPRENERLVRALEEVLACPDGPS